MSTLKLKSLDPNEQAKEIIEFAKENNLYPYLSWEVERNGKRDDAEFFLESYLSGTDYKTGRGRDGTLYITAEQGEPINYDALLDSIVEEYDYLGGEYYAEDTDNWWEAVVSVCEAAFEQEVI